jgi:rubredoxin
MYHADPAIDAEVRADALDVERFDLAAGYPARWWVCPDCGDAHRRGHYNGAIGAHRCLRCGYVGDGGTMHTNDPRPQPSRYE